MAASVAALAEPLAADRQRKIRYFCLTLWQTARNPGMLILAERGCNGRPLRSIIYVYYIDSDVCTQSKY